jgi:hypothetical protein
MNDDALSITNEGCVSLDWNTREKDALSIELAVDGSFVFAWVKADKTHGHGKGTLPKEAFEILKRVAAEADDQ